MYPSFRSLFLSKYRVDILSLFFKISNSQSYIIILAKEKKKKNIHYCATPNTAFTSGPSLPIINHPVIFSYHII